MLEGRLKDIDFKGLMGQTIAIAFLLEDVEVAPQAGGKKFMRLSLRDGNITEKARKFDVTKDDESLIQKGLSYYAKVAIKPYDSQSGYSLVISDIAVSDIPVTEFKNVEEGWEPALARIRERLGEIGRTTVGQIALEMLRSVWDKFCYTAAGSSNHHSGYGGLVVHTDEVCEIALAQADALEKCYGYTIINRPLLIAGAYCHDIGKVFELKTDVDTAVTEYSDIAKIGSHITFGIELFEKSVIRLGLGAMGEDKPASYVMLEAEEVNMLRHCIYSHHGKLDWGSPITPAIPEALLIHFGDMVSSRMSSMYTTYKKLEPGTGKSEFKGGELKNVYKPSYTDVDSAEI